MRTHQDHAGIGYLHSKELRGLNRRISNTHTKFLIFVNFHLLSIQWVINRRLKLLECLCSLDSELPEENPAFSHQQVA